MSSNQKIFKGIALFRIKTIKFSSKKTILNYYSIDKFNIRLLKFLKIKSLVNSP